jgi:molybdenum cofactor cytidylyltransferase
MLSAILLTAGESKRMGAPKQLMPWQQGTIVEKATDNLLCSDIDEVIVVLGYRAEEVRKCIASRPVKIVVNPDYKRGLSTSIIAGVNKVDSQSRAVMIALGDQPLINSRLINILIKKFLKSDKGIAVPAYQGKRGHPVIFSLKYREQLLNLRGDVGARQIIIDHPGDTLEVPVNCESVCTDIDTMDDYLAGRGT